MDIYYYKYNVSVLSTDISSLTAEKCIFTKMNIIILCEAQTSALSAQKCGHMLKWIKF